MAKENVKKKNIVKRIVNTAVAVPKAVYKGVIVPPFKYLGVSGVVGATLGSFYVGGPLGLVAGALLGKYHRETAEYIGETYNNLAEMPIKARLYEQIDPESAYKPRDLVEIVDENSNETTSGLGGKISSGFRMAGSTGKALYGKTEEVVRKYMSNRMNAKNFDTLREEVAKVLKRNPTFEEMKMIVEISKRGISAEE